jgi:hypothetical protein
VGQLAAGGMGIVYEAEQESLGRHVALKVLPTHTLVDPKRLQRFRREAKAAARLHHTNIVPVYGVGEHDGLHYYVMQFIQGLGLDEVLSELRRLRRNQQLPRTEDVQGPKRSNDVSAVAQALLTGQFAPDRASGVALAPRGREPQALPALTQPGSPVSDSSIHLPGQSDHATRSISRLRKSKDDSAGKEPLPLGEVRPLCAVPHDD